LTPDGHGRRTGDLSPERLFELRVINAHFPLAEQAVND
jgi:hypothetical protein